MNALEKIGINKINEHNSNIRQNMLDLKNDMESPATGKETNDELIAKFHNKLEIITADVLNNTNEISEIASALSKDICSET